MERYLYIGKENLKHNILLHILVCLLIFILSPFILGTANLEAVDTAKVLEMYVAITGIVLLPPIFLPEQNRDLRDLVYAKYMKASLVYVIRLVEALLILALLLAAYIGMLQINGCEMEVYKYFAGTLVEMMFFGGLGIFAYGLTDQLAAAYMIPLFYYIVAIGSGDKYLQMFYPFSMVQGSYEEKIYLAIAGIVLITAGILLRCRKK